MKNNENIFRNLQRSKVGIFSVITLICSPPYIAECFRIRATKWQLIADPALEVLGALDIGNHMRFLGVYSRFPWRHPGPAVYFFFAIPAKIGKDPAMSVAYWVIFFNLLLIATTITILWKSVGRHAALILGSCLILVNVNGIEGVSSAWNPSIALPIFTLMLITAMFTSSSRYTLLWTSILGSLVIQLHVGYAIPVFGILILLLFIQINQSKNGATLFSMRTFLLTIGINFLLWSLPIWDQIFGTGNFQKIIRDFAVEPKNVVGFHQALQILAFHLRPRAPWNGATEIASFVSPQKVGSSWILLPLVLVFFLAWVSVRHIPVLRAPVLTILIGIIAAYISIASLTGIAMPYMYVWLRILGSIFWGLLAYSAFLIILHSFPNYSRALFMGLVALAAFTLSISVRTTLNRSIPGEKAMNAVSYLTPFALELAPVGEQVGFVTSDFLSGIGDGLILQYELHNRHIRMNPNAFLNSDAVASRLGRQRVGLDLASVEVSVVLGTSVRSFVANGFSVQTSYDLSKDRSNGREINNEGTEVVYLVSRRIQPVKVRD